ncbi:5-formyltetrahydrofolate cyclo-ligase [soil metagenome]
MISILSNKEENNSKKSLSFLDHPRSLAGIFSTLKKHSLLLYIICQIGQNSSMSSQKLHLRSLLRSQRQALDPKQRHQAAIELAQHFLADPLFANNHNFALYIPVNGEMDTQPLLMHCLNVGKHCYLPRLMPQPSKQLCFVQFQKNDSLTVNRLGIKEPSYNKQKAILPENLHVVLMPLVAFDNNGNRLGMGAGYYDNTFAFLQNNTVVKPPRPMLIGLAYDFQEVAQLPKDSWDIPLDGVVTELGVRMFQLHHE